MDTAAGFTYQVIDRLERAGTPIVLAVLAFVVATLIVAVATAGLLGAASEPILMAPLRW